MLSTTTSVISVSLMHLLETPFNAERERHARTVNNTVFWEATPCFGGKHCFHLQSRRVSQKVDSADLAGYSPGLLFDPKK
jgi:hypothetical protein